jgi:hypothetical protein
VFEFRGSNEIQHRAGGGRNIVVSAGVAVVEVCACSAEATVVHPDGTVTDTHAEHLATEQAYLSDLALKILRSPTLRAMVNSLMNARRDPANALVHLYEIREAAVQHYGAEDVAATTLGVAKAEWRRLRRLANHEPLREGRHRGKQLGALRPATEEELTAARSVARRIIDALASRL